MVLEAAEWLKNSEFKNSKIYYYDPYFVHVLDLDPYNAEKVQERLPFPLRPEQGIPVGCLVLWDAHFGPNEGGLPLERLSGNKNFKKLKEFRPMEPFMVLGDNYEVFVFQRIE
ncbi:MAG: hypothetical protein M3R27_04790 [Bacteroidota bacterium]|nr:hypothetical protein [Bacteroidota bacterium]